MQIQGDAHRAWPGYLRCPPHDSQGRSAAFFSSMLAYSFEALDANGQARKGVLEADTGVLRAVRVVSCARRR